MFLLADGIIVWKKVSQRIQRKLDGRVRHGVRRQKAQQCHAVRLFEPDLIPETMTKDDQRIDWVSNLGEGRSDDLYGTSRRRILLQLC